VIRLGRGAIFGLPGHPSRNPVPRTSRGHTLEIRCCNIRFMRLALKVNDRNPIRASLQSNGYLSANLNLTKEPEREEATGRVWLQAIDESEEPNSVSSDWEGGALSVGDKVEILVLSDGDADPPTEIRRSSESPKNLFSSMEQARMLLSAISSCDKELMGIIDRARESEPPDEFRKIARSIGGIIYDLDRCLISPTLRRHPELFVEAKELKLIK